jgi:hypothetical protein
MGLSRLWIGFLRLSKMRLGHVPMARNIVFDTGNDANQF